MGKSVPEQDKHGNDDDGGCKIGLLKEVKLVEQEDVENVKGETRWWFQVHGWWSFAVVSSALGGPHVTSPGRPWEALLPWPPPPVLLVSRSTMHPACPLYGVVLWNRCLGSYHGASALQ